MSEPAEPDQPAERRNGGVAAGGEQMEALPVLRHEMELARARRSPGALASGFRPAGLALPAVQAAAVAAGGFVAGAAFVGLVHRRQRARALAKGGRAARELSRGSRRRARSAGRTAELVQIVGSRSLLVDVHLLGGSDS
jgi:hypothetical protein